MWMVPVITILASMFIQWGSFQANSANIQRQLTEQKIECEKKFERIEKEKADNDVMKEKFESIDWKLDLIMKNLGVTYNTKSRRDSI